MTRQATAKAQQAATTTSVASGILQRKCACGNHTVGGGECESCRQGKSAMHLQRAATGGGAINEVPPIVHDVLGSAGEPLDRKTREYFEPRFGHDFSRVRVHTDAKAVESARAVNALAYTVGNNIVFNTGVYAPNTHRGERLMAHELTHVVQQTGNEQAEPNSLTVGAPNTSAEKEADRMALQVTSAAPEIARVHQTSFGLQRLMCESILNAKEAPWEERVKGTEVERHIRTDFILQNGFKTTRFPIQGASSMPFRTGCGEEASEALGAGTPDLMYIDNNQAEIAEVKIGTWDCIGVAEPQVKNYVIKGNDPANAGWRRSMGLAGPAPFKLMPTSRFTPQPVIVGDKRASVGWCNDGLIVYKFVSRQDQDTFLCSNLSDKGAIDRFLTRILDKAQVKMEVYINQVAAEVYTWVDQEIAKHNFPLPAFVVKDILNTFKQKFLTMLREEVQTSLRQYLQHSLNVLCATAAAKGIVSLKEMLDKLDKEKGLVLVPALVAVCARLAKELGAEVLKAFALSVLIVATAALFAYVIYLSKGRVVIIVPKAIEFLMNNPEARKVIFGT